MIESAVPSLNESIKMIALNLFDTMQLSDVLFGKVVKVNPLEIMVDQKNVIPAQYLVLTNMVRDHSVDMTISMQTVEDNYLDANAMKHTHLAGALVGNLSAPVVGTTGTTTDFDTTHKHDIKGRKKITLHYGLKVGESVMLVRLQGGQRYVVIDRVQTPQTEGEWL